MTDERPQWVVESERFNEIVSEATGIEGHAIRCGWAVMEMAGAHSPWTEEGCESLVGLPFRWLRWKHSGAIVRAEPAADGRLVRVEVWAVP